MGRGSRPVGRAGQRIQALRRGGDESVHVPAPQQAAARRPAGRALMQRLRPRQRQRKQISLPHFS
eukprot:15443588-Alexandrium_andersonii.AAC.1